MEELIMNLLRFEGIKAVICSENFTYRDLGFLEVRYIGKDNKLYIARSFYTDVWASARPFGPSFTCDGTFIMRRISDIAEIFVFDTYEELSSERRFTLSDLILVYDKIESEVNNYLKDVLKGFDGIIHSKKLFFLPSPHVLVTFAYKSCNRLLGTVAVSLSGDIAAVSRCSAEIDIIVNELRARYAHPFMKELTDGCR